MLLVSIGSAQTYLQPAGGANAGGGSSSAAVYTNLGSLGAVASRPIRGGGYKLGSGVFAQFIPQQDTVPHPDAPQIIDFPDWYFTEDEPTGFESFIVADRDTPPLQVKVSAVSSNPEVIPTERIIFGGSGSNSLVRVRPLPNAYGVALVTVSATDGTHTTTEVFELVIQPINDLPTLSFIRNAGTLEDTPTGQVSFRIGDHETPAHKLLVSATVADETLVPDGNIEFGGAGSNRWMVITPAPDQFGETTITYRVSDGEAVTERTFPFFVAPRNDAPVVSPISDVVIHANEAAAVDFQLADIDDGIETLTAVAQSDNAALISHRELEIANLGGGQFQLSLVPKPDQTGQARITVTGRDPHGDPGQTTFLLTVLPPEIVSECFECTQVIGYSQVGAANGWYVKGGVFESLVEDERWQLLWENGATLDKWQDPNFSGWNNALVSPCAQTASMPDRVLLNLAGDYGSNVDDWIVNINATIDTIQLKLPSVRRIILQPVVGGPDNQTCEINGQAVRASESHPYMEEAIAVVVATREGTLPEVVAGLSPEVRDCSDYADNIGHFTPEGAVAAAGTIGQYYAALDADCELGDRPFGRLAARRDSDRSIRLSLIAFKKNRVRVDWSSNLNQWQPLESRSVVPGLVEFVDPNPDTNVRFYRAVRE